MNEQTNPVSEPTIATPNPVVADTPTIEPPQVEPAQIPVEPISTTPETAQTEPVSEPIETPTENPTAQLGRNEPLPESTPEPIPQGAAAPEVTTPTPSQTQQGTAQPEQTPPPASIPAQAPVIATPPQNIVGLILTKARAVIQLRKQKKLAKIMALFAKQTSVTNDQVEKLLHVSDATATRYLSELEKQGKITQTGKTGHAVTYTKR
jgi:hypothetical protein